MKRLQLFMAVAITLFVGCNKPAVDQPNNEELKKIINEKNARIAEFYHQGLADSVASFFADDAIQMIPNQKPSIGAQQIKTNLNQVMQFGTYTFSLIAVEVKSSGNLAVERGTYTLKFEPNENSPIPPQSDKGNYVLLWEKIDGDWKAVWDAPVSEVPIPGAE